MVTHIVKHHETLLSIAKQYNISVPELIKHNNLSSTAIHLGQELIIEHDNHHTYTVVKGDSLYSIAKRFNIKVIDLKQANDITGDLISINQVLLIPGSRIKFRTYRPSLEDTLFSVAKKFDTTIEEIKQLNNLTSDLLSFSQVLKIPSSKRVN